MPSCNFFFFMPSRVKLFFRRYEALLQLQEMFWFHSIYQTSKEGVQVAYKPIHTINQTLPGAIDRHNNLYSNKSAKIRCQDTPLPPSSLLYTSHPPFPGGPKKQSVILEFINGILLDPGFCFPGRFLIENLSLSWEFEKGKNTNPLQRVDQPATAGWEH